MLLVFLVIFVFGVIFLAMRSNLKANKTKKNKVEITGNKNKTIQDAGNSEKDSSSKENKIIIEGDSNVTMQDINNKTGNKN